MWDRHGNIFATYRAHDHMDELDSAVSLAFNVGGDRIYAGYNRMIRSFDVSRPGLEYTNHETCKSRKSQGGQKGIISCLSFNPDNSGCYAAGSYANSVSIYVENSQGSALDLQNLECGKACLST
jgi:WD40 repeat protein